MMAMKYVTGDDAMKQFDFVWTIRLRDVDEKSSLPELIRKQHGQLKKVSSERIKDILEGKTKHKVALLLDGYDEYKKRKNRGIDKAIEQGLGNCFLIVTSHPGYIDDNTRDKMDGEITIEGFSVQNIEKCCELFLGSKSAITEMLKQATASGIHNLDSDLLRKSFSARRMRDDAYLRVPIISLLTCWLFDVKKILPKTKTEIVKEFYELLIQKTSGRDTMSYTQKEELKYKLGKLAWEALQKDEKQLLLNKVGIYPVPYPKWTKG